MGLSGVRLLTTGSFAEGIPAGWLGIAVIVGINECGFGITDRLMWSALQIVECGNEASGHTARTTTFRGMAERLTTFT